MPQPQSSKVLLFLRCVFFRLVDYIRLFRASSSLPGSWCLVCWVTIKSARRYCIGNLGGSSQQTRRNRRHCSIYLPHETNACVKLALAVTGVGYFFSTSIYIIRNQCRYMFSCDSPRPRFRTREPWLFCYRFND